MNQFQCVICNAGFIQRHINHKTCHSSDCKTTLKKQTFKKWREKTGRVKPKQNLWTEEDINFLRENRHMTTQELSELLGRSKDSVREKRCRMKLPKLSICVVCGVEHQTINQHDTCEVCVPNQKESAKKYRNGLNGKFLQYRSNAKKRNIDFDLTIEEFSKFWQKPCFYCGSDIDTIGIDRVDSDLGYVEGNMVPCCFTCNQSKNDLSLSEWVCHLKSVLRNLGEKL